jgi:hypothetical protein
MHNGIVRFVSRKIATPPRPAGPDFRNIIVRFVPWEMKGVPPDARGIVRFVSRNSTRRRGAAHQHLMVSAARRIRLKKIRGRGLPGVHFQMRRAHPRRSPGVPHRPRRKQRFQRATVATYVTSSARQVKIARARIAAGTTLSVARSVTFKVCCRIGHRPIQNFGNPSDAPPHGRRIPSLF